MCYFLVDSWIRIIFFTANSADSVQMQVLRKNLPINYQSSKAWKDSRYEQCFLYLKSNKISTQSDEMTIFLWYFLAGTNASNDPATATCKPCGRHFGSVYDLRRHYQTNAHKQRIRDGVEYKSSSSSSKSWFTTNSAFQTNGLFICRLELQLLVHRMNSHTTQTFKLHAAKTDNFDSRSDLKTDLEW